MIQWKASICFVSSMIRLDLFVPEIIHNRPIRWSFDSYRLSVVVFLFLFLRNLFNLSPCRPDYLHLTFSRFSAGRFHCSLFYSLPSNKPHHCVISTLFYISVLSSPLSPVCFNSRKSLFSPEEARMHWEYKPCSAYRSFVDRREARMRRTSQYIENVSLNM